MAWFTKLLLRIAIRRLPEAERARFSEEWASHIDEVPGEINKVATALGCVSAARQIASLLKSREPSRSHRVRDDHTQRRKEKQSEQRTSNGPTSRTLYPDLSQREDGRKLFHVTKRVMDVLGSALAMVFFSPVFLFIAIAIKATSRGPVLFRQRRVGQHGNSFMFLKFRSMHANNDAAVHKEYVQQLIAGKADKHPSDGSEGVYKLTKDRRITPVGAFLRKFSLDELPQFFNVLKGEMSLVGPRPPIPYEVEAYDIWHRRRLLEAKPGITGLWQVSGRSRVKFDDMVRLDLQYARNWSPWMDIKILLRTPGAMVLGEGAH